MVLVVRSHKVSFVLERGQIVGRLGYERRSEPPEGCTASNSAPTIRRKN